MTSLTPTAHDAAAARRRVFLLLAGVVAGLVLAVAGAVTPTGPVGGGAGLAPDVVASVDGTTITREDLQAAVSMLAADAREAPDTTDVRHVLDRLIDEELLVGRAMELGLAADDPTVRRVLVAAMMDAAVAAEASRPATELELRTFFEERRDYFAAEPRIAAGQVLFVGDAEDAALRERAAAARAALEAGQNFADVEREFGDRPLQPLPARALDPTSLREIVGATAARALATAAAGSLLGPLRSPYGLQLLVVFERVPAAAPELDAVRASVEAEFSRRRRDAALRDYIDKLRERAAVVVREDLE